jgi:hypothetical protein
MISYPTRSTATGSVPKKHAPELMDILGIVAGAPVVATLQAVHDIQDHLVAKGRERANLGGGLRPEILVQPPGIGDCPVGQVLHA